MLGGWWLTPKPSPLASQIDAQRGNQNRSMHPQLDDELRHWAAEYYTDQKKRGKTPFVGKRAQCGGGEVLGAARVVVGGSFTSAHPVHA